MEELPVYMITMWHPERFLKPPMSQNDLSWSQMASLPHIRQNRQDVETERTAMARAHGLPLYPRVFHGRLILNTGKTVDELRTTWIPGSMVGECLSAFVVRLIHTDGEGSQARYKLQWQLDWDDDPNALDAEFVQRITDNVERSERLSIRALWRNPLAGVSGNVPLESYPGGAAEVVNLVVGPIKKKEWECRRQARISFEKRDDTWWVSF